MCGIETLDELIICTFSGIQIYGNPIYGLLAYLKIQFSLVSLINTIERANENTDDRVTQNVIFPVS